jgi:cell division GTPase FtsZ
MSKVCVLGIGNSSTDIIRPLIIKGIDMMEFMVVDYDSPNFHCSQHKELLILEDNLSTINHLGYDQLLKKLSSYSMMVLLCDINEFHNELEQLTEGLKGLDTLKIGLFICNNKSNYDSDYYINKLDCVLVYQRQGREDEILIETAMVALGDLAANRGGIIPLSFGDLAGILTSSGQVHIGFGCHRSLGGIDAAKEAILSIGYKTFRKSKSMAVHISGPPGFTIGEVIDIYNYIAGEADEDAHIVFGGYTNTSPYYNIGVTIIVTFKDLDRMQEDMEIPQFIIRRRMGL